MSTHDAILACGSACKSPSRASVSIMPTLRRVVSRWQIVALALNDVVGSGVYLLPAAAAAMLGPASLWAVALAGLAVLLIVLCFAEASSRFDEPGSAYLYAREAFGAFIGFEVGWMMWLARVASVASLSVGFALALGYLLPAATQRKSAAPSAIVAAAHCSHRHQHRWSTVRRQHRGRAGALGKLLPLTIFVAVGIFRGVAIADLPDRSLSSGGGLGQAALLLLFAYAGSRTPRPRPASSRTRAGTYRSLSSSRSESSRLLYVAVQWVALGTVPDLGASETPLADGARIFLGQWGGWLLTAGAVVSILGTNQQLRSRRARGISLLLPA